MQPVEFFESRKIPFKDAAESSASHWLLWCELGSSPFALSDRHVVALMSWKLVEHFFESAEKYGLEDSWRVIPIGPAEKMALEEHMRFREFSNYVEFAQAVVESAKELVIALNLSNPK